MKDKSLQSRTTTKLHCSKRGLIDLTIFFKTKILEHFFSNTMVAAVSVEDLGSLRNEIQDGGMGGGWAKRASYQFFPCNFYNRRNSPQKLSEF